MSTEASVARDLADLEAELGAIDVEQQRKDAAVYRERLLRQALAGVEDATANQRRLVVKLEGIDLAISQVTKIGKVSSALGSGVPGARTALVEGAGVKAIQIDDLAEFVRDVVTNSLTRLNLQRQEAAESLRRTEDRLALAKAEAAKLR